MNNNIYFFLYVSGGKLGERTLRSKTIFVYDYGELIRLIQDTTITINSILPIDEDCLQINYTPVEDMVETSKTVSLIHAAYTTAHGRLLLYKYLDVVDERTLYHDTGTKTYIFLKKTFGFFLNLTLLCFAFFRFRVFPFRPWAA